MRSSNPFSGRFRKIALMLAILIGFACGPGPSDLNEFMSFFMPESSHTRPEDKRFFFTPQLYDYEAGSEADTLTIDENRQAWDTYTNNKLTDQELNEGLYEGIDVNTMTRYLQTNNASAYAYLQLAYNANKAAPSSSDVWNTEPADSTRLLSLLDQAKTAYAAAPDKFLKERYGFQAVKLADQVKDYSQCLALYDQFIKPLPNKTFISDWALCRRAGANLALGDTARAIYEFATVFDRCPSRRQEAEASLRIYGIRFQEKALSYAQNDHEKAAIYALCAIQPRQDALPFLEEIVKLTPQNPLIELILAREINRNEYYFFESRNPVYVEDEKTRADSIAYENRRTGTTSYFEKLKNFVLSAAENKQLKNPAYFLTAAAYLDYLANDYDSAGETLEKAAQQPTTNEALKKQIVLQQMLLLAARDETITPQTEAALIGYLERFGKSDDFRLNNGFVRVCQQFADRYRGQTNETKGGWLFSCSRSADKQPSEANTAKAFLLTMLTTHELANEQEYFMNNTNQLAIEDTTSAAVARQVVQFATQSTPADFDKRLLALTGFTNDYLYTLLGRRLIAEHEYAEAADAWSKVNARVWKDEPFTSNFDENPFTINMPGEKAANPYTPITFAQRMAELQEKAKTAAGDQAAELYYQLGCGAYNLSWHGNAWLLVRRYRSTVEPNVYEYAPYGGPVNNAGLQRLAQDAYYTTTPARAFFEQATKAAKSPELAAKATYMAARCEENAFTARKAIEQAKHGFDADPQPFNNEMISLREKEYGTLFNQYKKQFTNSHFHDEMVRECALYSDFLAGKTAVSSE